MKKKRELICSVSKDDCTWQYFRGSGPGGQHRNKTSTGVRCTHSPSGAVGVATDNKSQLQNRRMAMRRMSETKEFRLWVKIQAGIIMSLEDKVKKEMQPSKIRSEVYKNGKWVEETY